MNCEQVVIDLTNLGFFKFVPPLHLEEARRRTVTALARDRSLDFGRDWDPELMARTARSGTPAWLGERYFHADAEELAEGGVADFVWTLIPLLEQESVSVDFLASCKDWNVESGRTSYEILVNSDRYSVYQFELNEELDLRYWAHRRTIETLNALLERAGSPEYAFGAASRNDAGIYILTASLYDYVRELPLHPVYVPAPVEDLASDAG